MRKASPAVLALAALVALSTALRWWAAERIPTPWIAPDELLYGLLGRSLWQTGRLELLGEPLRFFSLVTPAIAGLPLRAGNVEWGYDLLKGVQSLVMSLAAVPVYVWGRSFLRPGSALVAAALTLTIPGLVYSGLIMTEVAFFPAVVLAAWAIAAALERPSIVRQCVALAAIALAALTRLQGAALLAAFATAVVVEVVLARQPRRALRFWPFAAGAVLLAVAWSAYRLRHGGPASQILGGYQAAGEIHYSVADAARFVLYHLEDVLVLAGVIPVCATVVLLVEAVRGSESSGAVRAWLATTVGISAWFVLEVGVFASRHVGLLAERNLFAVAPLFFLGLALWLQRGAPRPRITTAAVGFVALALLVALPVAHFASHASLPDTFTLIPLYKLHARYPSVDVELVADAAFAAAMVVFALVPRRALIALPAALGMVFAAGSVSASRVVAGEAAQTNLGLVGSDPRWVDQHARGDVAYLYTGDVQWPSVWQTAFWNRRIRAVYGMLLTQVPGGIPQQSVGPEEDGRVVTADGKVIPWRYVVASTSMTFRGRHIDDSGPGVALWRLDPPFRLTTWTQNVRFDSVVESHAKVFVYACRGGEIRLRIDTLGPRTIRLFRNEQLVERLRIGGRVARHIPLRRPRGRGLCSFDLFTNAPVKVERLDYVPPR